MSTRVEMLLQVQDLLFDNKRRFETRLAEYTALYPDPADLEIVSNRSDGSLDSICLYFAVTYCLLDKAGYAVYCLSEQMAQRAYNFRYEGEWSNLQGFLQITPRLAYQLEYLLSKYSPEDIFGNIIPRVAKQIDGLRFQSIRARARRLERRRVKKSVRRRGYRDHGTLRTVEELARVEANRQSPKPERVDLRTFIWHPRLPREWIPDAYVPSLGRDVLNRAFVWVKPLITKNESRF